MVADFDGGGAWGGGVWERERVHVAVAEEGASADEGVFAEGDAAEGGLTEGAMRDAIIFFRLSFRVSGLQLFSFYPFEFRGPEAGGSE